MSGKLFVSAIRRAIGFCGSLGIAAALMVVLAILCGWGTFIELDFGTPAASLLIYRNPAFRFLIFLLALNIFSAVLGRLPWKRRHVPFLCAHLGVLLLLFGCWVTSRFACEGNMTITEGTESSTILLNNLREIVVERSSTDPVETSCFSIPFFGGPFNSSDRTAAGWRRDLFRPAWDAIIPERGVLPSLSRFCFKMHYRLTGLLLRLCRTPAVGMIPTEASGLLRLEVVDYLVHCDLRASEPLRLSLERPETDTGENRTEEVLFRFDNLQSQPKDTVVSQRGIRRWLPDGTRVVFSLADSCGQALSALRLTPEMPDPDSPQQPPLFELAFDSGEKLTRIPYSELNNHVPDYSDPNKMETLSPEVDVDLGRGWHLVRIEIVPTIVPGLETIQGWTARAELRQNETGKTDRLQLSSDWRERDIQGELSGITGALFGALPNRSETKILGRRWDKCLQSPLLELIQSPDGELCFRYWDGASSFASSRLIRDENGKYPPVELPDGGVFSLNEFAPQDELGFRLVSVPFNKETANEFYCKVRLRALLKSASGIESSEMFWLRAVPTGMVGLDESIFSRTVFDADGALYRFRLTGRTLDPGFSIFVQNFQPIYEPGSSVPSSFASTVNYIPYLKDDPDIKDSKGERNGVLIKMNHPGVFHSPTKHLSFWAYQDSFRGPFHPGNPIFDQTVKGELLPGETIPREQIYQTVLSLNADPGRGLKYLGCFFLVSGTALLFFRKTVMKAAKPFLTILVGFFLLSTQAGFSGEGVVSAHEARLDWTAWRLIPVFDEGRVMPLNSYAAITVKEICGTDAPLISVSTKLLAELESGTAVSMLPLDAFLSGRKVTQAQRKELERAYNEIKIRKAAAQKSAAKRIRRLVPGNGRRFTASELLFTWLSEPEVWEYIPFIADPGNIVHDLIDPGNDIGQNRSFLSPAQLRGMPLFTERIDSLMAGEIHEFADWETAVREGKIDRACAMAESRLSQFDALVFWPTREKTAGAEIELSNLLYLPDVNQHAKDRLTLLEELNQSVSELKRETVRQTTISATPFEEEDFYPAQTVEIGSGSKKIPVLRIIGDLHSIAARWETDAYRENERRLRAISEKFSSAYLRALTWRDELFTGEEGTPEYRQIAVKTVRILGLVATRLEKVVCEVWTGRWKTAVRVPDKKRIEVRSGSDGCLAHPAARFTSRGTGTLSILPNPRAKKDSGEERDSLVWLPIQSVLWSVPSGPSPEKERTSPQGESSSVAEMLKEKLANEANDSDLAARAFLDAVEAYRSTATDRADLFREAMERFTGELRTIGETDRATQAVPYPAVGALNAEYNYFRLDPFWGLWFFSLLALVSLVLSIVCAKGRVAKSLFLLGVVFLLLAESITAVGGALRAYITGWAPVTNMFETVVLLAFLVLAVILGYAFYPLLGTKMLWCWDHSHKGGKYQTARRATRLILTVLVLWGTLWVCYREQGKQIGTWQAFTESFLAQGLLDRAAILGTIATIVWFVPRFLISIFLIPFAPRMTAEMRKALMPKVLDRRMFVAIGALLAFVIGLLAYYNTTEFNPNIRPLTAVLRSNFWLTVHVLAIMFSYALGALAWVLSLMVLGAAFFGRPSADGSEPELSARYRSIILVLLRFAVLFLTMGIILGARWADFSWGRFWSWDPKEVWALVTLLIYLTVLHFRRRGLILPLGGLLGGLSILMTWYGLSFVFSGGGRHSYAAGESSRTMVLYILFAVNLLYGFSAWVVWFIRKRKPIVSGILSASDGPLPNAISSDTNVIEKQQ
ncbi:MAG: cytochrome c biogenesis protein [Thermoguttaceae bacterium]